MFGSRVMNVDATLAEWFAKRSGTYVEVILGGQVFGGRIGEAPQKPRDYQWDGATLLIRFGTTEELEIQEPGGIAIGPRFDLTIPEAKRVRWSWHYYGRPQTPSNRCEEVLVPEADALQVVRTGPTLSAGHERRQRSTAPLVWLY